MDDHIPEECMDDAERYIIKRLLVNFLMRRDKCCPACLIELLADLADDSSELWGELNSDKPVCTYRH